jgi:hypothetical protein
MLGEMKPDDRMPAFFIRGWSEEGTDDARKENIERVKKYQELAREWDTAGLSERVSEVTLIDVRDVRAQLAGGDSQIEVRLGSQDAGKRLKIALEALDMYKQSARGSSITYVDLQTGRVVIGFCSGNKATSDPTAPTSDANDNANLSAPARTDNPTNKVETKPNASNKDAAKKPKPDKPANDGQKNARKNDRTKEVKPAALRFR